MENTDIYRVSSSFRIDSSSPWRNTGVEVFSRSSREEDDEEALKWAALEKLPTDNRLKKGLWSGSQGAASEIDVDNLGYQERKNLLERLEKVAEEDNEKFLLKLKDRIDRVGIDMPTVEVRYEHLTIDAEAYAGSRALPTFINFCSNIVEVVAIVGPRRRGGLVHRVAELLKLDGVSAAFARGTATATATATAMGARTVTTSQGNG
ncbi:hypothetical protein L1049_004855 [Liquidambar formosana]|uniref:Pleiotropic ABC efflux transporter N-terminal domain-containing protein n=1 Tax=Liquidambar formosana TaxID=63359 RepID=A0AAP0RP61_LIQFO